MLSLISDWIALILNHLHELIFIAKFVKTNIFRETEYDSFSAKCLKHFR